MKTSPSQSQEARIDAYLRGELTGSELDSFTEQLRLDPKLARMLREQEAIDQALLRVVGTPPTVALPVGSADANDQRGVLARPTFSWRRALAIAAVMTLLLAGAWLLWPRRGNGPAVNPYAPQPYRSMLAVYEDDIAKDLEPDWVCETDEEFAQAISQLYVTPLLLAEMPSGVEAVGLSYSNTVSDFTTRLLARVNGKPVLVFIDIEPRDFQLDPIDHAQLKLHQTQLEPFTLYELSPFDEPRVSQYIYRPE